MFGKVKRLHFIGIGGIGMSGLALIMKNLGFEVTGSDIKRSETTEMLTKTGIKITYEHKKENIS
ncbi:MAG: Mur ligase domain-containing protein, partial [candidate division WOR-3 bacterium]